MNTSTCYDRAMSYFLGCFRRSRLTLQSVMAFLPTFRAQKDLWGRANGPKSVPVSNASPPLLARRQNTGVLSTQTPAQTPAVVKVPVLPTHPPLPTADGFTSSLSHGPTAHPATAHRYDVGVVRRAVTKGRRSSVSGVMSPLAPAKRKERKPAGRR